MLATYLQYHYLPKQHYLVMPHNLELLVRAFEEVEKLSEGVALDMDGFELNVSLRKA